MNKTINNSMNRNESSIENILRLNKLLDSLSGNSFVDNRDENSFDDHFLEPDFDVFLVLINSFRQLKDNCYKRNKLLSLMTTYIYCNDTLKSLLLKTCELSSNELQIIGSKLSTILVSIPELVSNTMKANNCQKFDQKVYFNRIIQTIYICVEDVYQSISEGIDSSLEFLSSLLGRIAFIGFSDIVFNEVLDKLWIKCKNDFIWRRIAYRLIVLQQKREYIEVLIKTIFTLIPDSEAIVGIIGKSVETNPKIKFLVTNKFLLINEFKSDRILDNIFGYLSHNCLKLFFEAFANLLNGWSNSSAIKYRSYSQHLYLSKGLMIGAKFMKDMDLTEVEDRFRSITMSGVELHLKNSQQDFRNIGLTVGQTLMTLFCGQSGEKSGIDFEVEQNEEIKYLNQLFTNNCNQTNLVNIEPKVWIKTDIKEEELVPKERIKTINKDTPELDSDDDEDSDLIPYDMSYDQLTEETKRPVYVRDCMEGLLDYEKTEWFTKCLQNAEQIIRNNCNSINEMSVEFAQILLRLDDNCAVDDFIGLRLRAMIALCVCAPKPVANYLCSQFYAQNHTIRQRLDVLEVLLSASSELSSNIQQKPNKTHLKCESVVTQEEELKAETHWTQVVKSRVEAKTRILSHKSKDPNESSYVNRFAPFAEHFFFPLLKSFSRNEVKLDLLEDDHYVLGRLLYTIGIVVKNVAMNPIAKQMAKELLDLILAFRYHCEVYVREALIFDFCMVLMSVSPIYLMSDLSLQMVELQHWLKDITEREANTRCVQKAVTALQLLKQVVQEMPLNCK